jgi:hypothetical protein
LRRSTGETVAGHERLRLEVALHALDLRQELGLLERVLVVGREQDFEPEGRDDPALEEPDILVHPRARAEVVVDVGVDPELHGAREAQQEEHRRW